MGQIERIRKGLDKHPARILEAGNRPQAAVAMILREMKDGIHVLLIERAVNDQDFWSGEIGLPGGRKETFDAGLRQTAERETLEELGFDLGSAQYVGRLDDYAPGGLQIVISGFVYAVQHRPVFYPDREEIAKAFWVPLREIGNPSRRCTVEFVFRNRPRRFPALRLDHGQPLWGITYRLLRNLCKVIANREKPGLAAIQ